jgi:hypothetical protein
MIVLASALCGEDVAAQGRDVWDRAALEFTILSEVFTVRDANGNYDKQASLNRLAQWATDTYQNRWLPQRTVVATQVLRMTPIP